MTYTINKFYKNHVTVSAEVVHVGLELSTENLILKPTPGLPADAGDLAYFVICSQYVCWCFLS